MIYLDNENTKDENIFS